MNKILLLALLISSQAFSQDASEEAIILNQELQFLEESASNVTVLSATQKPSQDQARPIDTSSLEEKYFGNSTEDEVSSRTSAPKRSRSY